MTDTFIGWCNPHRKAVKKGIKMKYSYDITHNTYSTVDLLWFLKATKK